MIRSKKDFIIAPLVNIFEVKKLNFAFYREAIIRLLIN